MPFADLAALRARLARPGARFPMHPARRASFVTRIAIPCPRVALRLTTIATPSHGTEPRMGFIEPGGYR